MKNQKMKIGPIPYIYPIPAVLVGANVNGRPNFELIGQTGLMGIKPPVVYISSGASPYTNQGIIANDVFSINIPHSGMLAKVDMCGVVLGRDYNKAALFEVFYGELEKAPMILECRLNLECRVIRQFSIEHRQIFAARVVQTFVDAEYAISKEKRFEGSELRLLDPIIYALDNRYYQIGDPIGRGYQEAGKLPEGPIQPRLG
jgi:flavin reductase (DIM6/NTAB) family NADH-FMN oxidoreductase RutF